MFIKILIAKIVFQLSRILGFGSGYTYSGHILLKLDKNILKFFLDQLTEGVVFVSGTNGKTTTTKIICEVLTASGFSVVSNSSGANLLNGITSSLALCADYKGNLKSKLGVFEVDEFVLPKILQICKPKLLLLLNLSRDQLDRYGETDTILERWSEVFAETALDKSTKIIYDSTQEYFLEKFKNHHKYIGFVVKDFGNDARLRGYYNAKNYSAAQEVCKNFDVTDDSFATAIRNINFAWGRGELLKNTTNTYEILLAKNPASFNSNLDLIKDHYSNNSEFLFILNDNIPDGRDISWIYDIESPKLNSVFANKDLYFAGTRATEMALRLKYAGLQVSADNIFKKLSGTLLSLSTKNIKENIVVLPNYSAMQELRKILLGRKLL